MKKKLFPIMILFMLASGIAFANNGNVKPVVLNNFKTAYTEASDVSWEKTGNFNKASFWMNGKELYAIYTNDGQKVAQARNLLSSDLPGQLQGSLNNNFPKYWITELFEYSTKGETKYFVTIENSDEKQLLESIGTTEWSLVRKTAK